jgi:hypothetical protein
MMTTLKGTDTVPHTTHRNRTEEERAMKLNKDNKYTIEVGDQLKFNESEVYTVTTIIPCRNGVNFTLRDIKTGQTIYSHPSSQCYGAEVIKAEANRGAGAAYLTAYEKAEDLAFRLDVAIANKLHPMEHKSGSINWGDVGAMNRIIEKLNEVLDLVDDYTRNI